MEGKVVILGGGVAALGATYHLVKHGTHPVIIERSREIGGLASSYRIGDFYIERFYHHFFPTDTLVFDLAKELGIENKMLWKKTRMGFYHKDKLYGFTSPLDIIRFMPLSFANRVRFGLTMLKIAKTREFGNLDKLTAKEWLISTFGQEIYQEIFLPMLKIKFAMSLDKQGRSRGQGTSARRSSVTWRTATTTSSMQCIGRQKVSAVFITILKSWKSNTMNTIIPLKQGKVAKSPL